MAGKAKPGFYAVRVGRNPGVYTTWPEAEAQVKGFAGALHKKFPTEREARDWAGKTPSTIISPAEPRKDHARRGSLAAANGSGGSAVNNGSGASSSTRTRRREGDSDERSSKRTRTVDLVFGNSSGTSVRKVYCDGSSRGNGKQGAVAGIGVFWGHEIGSPNLSERLPGSLQTNNRAEMYAVARILETDPRPHEPLTICTDSQYTISVFSEWIPGWKRRGWKTSTGTPVLNKDLILYVLSLLALRAQPTKSRHFASRTTNKSAVNGSSTSSSSSSASLLSNVTFQKVKAHVGIDGNEMADTLANEGAAMPVAPERNFEALTRANEAELKRRTGDDHVRPEDVEWIVGDDLLSTEELDRMGRSGEFD